MYLGWAVFDDVLEHLDTIAREKGLYEDKQPEDEGCEEHRGPYPRDAWYVLETMKNLLSDVFAQLRASFPDAHAELDQCILVHLIEVSGREHTIVLSICCNRTLHLLPLGVVAAMKKILQFKEDPEWYIAPPSQYSMKDYLKS